MRPGIRDDTERSDDRSTHRGQTGYRVTAGLLREHKLALRTRSHTHTRTHTLRVILGYFFFHLA